MPEFPMLLKRLWTGAMGNPLVLPPGFPCREVFQRLIPAVERLRAIVMMAFLLGGPFMFAALVMDRFETERKAETLAMRGLPARAVLVNLAKSSSGKAAHSYETYQLTYRYHVTGDAADHAQAGYPIAVTRRVQKGKAFVPPSNIGIIYDPENPRVSAVSIAQLTRKVSAARLYLPAFLLVYAFLFFVCYFNGARLSAKARVQANA